MKLPEPCHECGKTEACYGCINDLYRDIDKHDVTHDTYGNRGEPKPSYNMWTGTMDDD